MEVSGYQQLFSYSLENVFCIQHKEEIHTGLKYNMKVNKWWQFFGVNYPFKWNARQFSWWFSFSAIELYQLNRDTAMGSLDNLTDSGSCEKSYLLLRDLLPAALTAELRNAVDNQD